MVMVERSRSEYRWLLDINEMAIKPTFDLNKLVGSIDVNRYPDSESVNLREVLAEKVRTTVKGAEWVMRENLILGNGSDEVLKLVLEGLLDKSDIVLIPEPTFSEYERLVNITGCKCIKMNFGMDTFDADSLAEAINASGAKLLFLSNPNNPTGAFMDADSIERIAMRTAAWIVVDEAYGDFAKSSAVGRVKSNAKIIVVRTLSKSYGLAALRIGFLIADRSVVNRLSPFKMTYNIYGVSEMVAMEVLGDTRYAEAYVARVKQVRDKAYSLLSLMEEVEVFPSEGNFLLIRIKSLSRFKRLLLNLEEKGMRVRWFNGSQTLERCIRLTITSEEDFNAFFDFLLASGSESGGVIR